MPRVTVQLLTLVVATTACGDGSGPSPTGSIEITSVTEGEPADPDGYTVAIDSQPVPLGPNAAITVSGVGLGDHELELRGVAPNCSLVGDNPRTITVTAEAPLRLTLTIACAIGRGGIIVRTQTIGPNVDADGFTIQLDGAEPQAIDLNRFAMYPALPVGEHTLLLAGIAPNCSVAEPNPRTLAVTPGAEVLTTFSVGCHSTAPGTLLLTSDRSGEQHIYRVDPDGSGLEELTRQEDGALPDWSPDHLRIAFASSRDGDEGVYVMNADGSSPVRLAAGGTPAWSPDGTRIAYSGPDGVTVMKADGSEPVVLALGSGPTWSPDGTQIAFTGRTRCAEFFCGLALYLMRADGSAVRRLTPDDFWTDLSQPPSWSPDGTLIAFSHRECRFLLGCRSGIWTIQPSGGTPSRIYLGPAVGRPVWSPDGATLAFAVSQENGTTELMLMPSTGGAPNVLASSPGSEYPGSWR